MSMDWFSRSGREGWALGRCLTPCPRSPDPPRWGTPRRGLTAQHVVVGIVGDGVDVRGCLGAPLALVGCHHRRGVDGQPLVGVDSDTEEPRVGLQGEGGADECPVGCPDAPSPPHPTGWTPVARGLSAYVDHPMGVAALQVVEDRGLVEVRQHRHVLNHVELGGVHELHLILLHHPRLPEEGGHVRWTLAPTKHPLPQNPPGGQAYRQSHAGDNPGPVTAVFPTGLPSILG